MNYKKFYSIIIQNKNLTLLNYCYHYTNEDLTISIITYRLYNSKHMTYQKITSNFIQNWITVLFVFFRVLSNYPKFKKKKKLAKVSKHFVKKNKKKEKK
jgi:hypothetical protein